MEDEIAVQRELERRLRRVLRLLEKTQPLSTDGDVRWSGPFFIPRSGEWWPTHFLLYRDELFCNVDVAWSTMTLVWTVNSTKMRFEGQASFGTGYQNGEALWAWILDQVETRLRSALANPDAYNRRVARLFPLRCRTGRIERRFSWPLRSRPPMTPADLSRLARALEQGKNARNRSGPGTDIPVS